VLGTSRKHPQAVGLDGKEGVVILIDRVGHRLDRCGGKFALSTRPAASWEFRLYEALLVRFAQRLAQSLSGASE
jgi:hypothetical protein